MLSQFSDLRNATLSPLPPLASALEGEAAERSLEPRCGIELPGVSGRIDHLAFDGPHERLYVTALGNDTVEVIDSAAGTHLRSLRSHRGPRARRRSRRRVGS